MSYSQLRHRPLGGTAFGGDSRDKPISPEDVILWGGVALPVLLVLAAIWQLTGEVPLPSTAFLPLSLLSACFTTLSLCLVAHVYVSSQARRSVVIIQVVFALALIWIGYSYSVLGSRPFQSAVAFLTVASEAQRLIC